MPLIPQRLDERILAGLGSIVVQSATVDGFLAEFVSYLLQAHPTSMYVVTQSVAVSTLSGWARTLVDDQMAEPFRTQALEVLSACDDIRAVRNSWIHGLWEVGPEPATATAVMHLSYHG